MSNKVTKSDLEKLIEGVLSEKSYYKFPKLSKKSPTGGGNKEIVKTRIKKDDGDEIGDTMAGKIALLTLQDDNVSLTDADLEAAYTLNPRNRQKDKIRTAADFFRKTSSNNAVKQAAKDAFQTSEYFYEWFENRVMKIDKKSASEIEGDDGETTQSNMQVATRSEINIERVKYLHKIASNQDEMSQKTPKGSNKTYADLAKEFLEKEVTETLGVISIVQDFIGTSDEIARELIQAFQKSALKKRRLPYKPQDPTDREREGDKGQDVTTTTISDPSLSTGGSDRAAYRQELIDVFKGVAEVAGGRAGALKGAKFWINSLKHISEFSAFIASQTKAELKEVVGIEKFSLTDLGLQFQNMTATQYLTMTIALDYCYRFAKEIEGGGGAYQFEAFLGLLAGGYVGGKEPGIAGGPGEADFVIQHGDEVFMGSAKYYASDSASQSARSFELNEGVAYVYAKKYSDEKKTTTSDALDIMKIGLHVFTIQKVYSTALDSKGTTLQEGTGGKADKLENFDENDPAASGLESGTSVFKFMATAKGDEKGVAGEVLGYYACPSLGQIALKPGVVEHARETLVGTLDLPKVTQEQLTAAHQSASKKVDGEVNKAFDAFKNLFKNFQIAKKTATQYSTSANFETGKEAFKAIKEAKDNFVELSDKIAGEGEKITDTVQESKKITANFLKKIIEESFKK